MLWQKRRLASQLHLLVNRPIDKLENDRLKYGHYHKHLDKLENGPQVICAMIL